MLEMLVRDNSTANPDSVGNVADTAESAVHDSDIIRATSTLIEDETDFLDRKLMPQHNGLWAGQKEV